MYSTRRTIMQEPYKKLNPKARFAMAISSIQVTIIVAIILVIIRTICHLFKFIQPIYKPIDITFAIIFAIPILMIFFYPTIGYRRQSYRITDVSVEKITGIINIEREVVPIRRMQQINITSNWINRLFGLADIHIVTAGGDMTLDYIGIEEALTISENLKNTIHEIALIQAENKEDYTADISNHLKGEDLYDGK